MYQEMAVRQIIMMWQETVLQQQMIVRLQLILSQLQEQ